MSKGGACFDCRQCGDSTPDTIGWIHACRLGIDNATFNNRETIAADCPRFDPRDGFQMGGTYTHMWFESSKADAEPNGCLEWVIQGDLDFPIPDNGPEGRLPIKIHICDFRQIEAWVAFWGQELRSRGWVVDESPPRGRT